MENQSHKQFNLSKARDFGGCFEFSFKYLKMHAKPILMVAVYMLPLVLLATVLMPTQSDMNNMIEDMTHGYYYSSGFYVKMILGLIVYTIAGLVVTVYVMVYMKRNNESETDIIDISTIWDDVKALFLPLLGGQMLLGFIVGLGIVLCIIPGIFLLVVFMFFQYAYVNEDLTIMESFRRSREIVKGRWWETFAYIMIVAIGVGLINSIFSLPSFLIEFGFISNTVAIYIISFVSRGVAMLLSCVSIAMYGVWYYSLTSKEGDNHLYNQIDNIGTGDYER